MQHVKIIVAGRVQGVYFRANTKKTALALSIIGTVKNRYDGSVEIQAAGKEQDIQKFIQWCHQGPVLAKVKSVSLTQLSTPPQYNSFTIIDSDA